MRYNLISNPASSTPAGETMQGTLAESSRALDMFIKPREAGEDRVAFSQLKSITTDADMGLRAMSVCGTGGGLGTTSIVRKVYEDSEICSKFKCRAWVKLVLPFKLDEFIRDLADQFYTNSHQKAGGALSGADVVARMHKPVDTLVDEVVKQVSTERYLIILEDLSGIAQWDAVRAYLPDMRNGSRIVVSTRHLEIASLCVGQPYEVSEIRQFSANHSVCLFSKKIKRDNMDLQGIKDESGHDDEPKKFPDSEIMDDTQNVFKEKDIQDGYKSSSRGQPPLLQIAARRSLRNIRLRGRDSDAEELEKKITLARNSGTHHVVSLWGMSGVGKSVLVRTVLDRCQDKRMFEKYAWLDAPEDPEVDLWTLFLRQCLGQTGTCDANKALDLLRRHLWLIVIDLMELNLDWDFFIKKLSHETRNCIVVVTRDESFARHCATRDDEVCHIKDVGYNVADVDMDIHVDNCSRTNERQSLEKTALRWLKNVCLVGRDSERKQLINHLLYNTNKHHVLSVWGAAGVGKSVLVRTVYYSCVVSVGGCGLGLMFDMYARVHAPQNLDMMGFCDNLCSELWPSLPKQRDPIGKCTDLLRENRCLVVIDRLELKDVWESVRSALSLEDSKSCIVVVTRDKSVARQCAKASDDAVFHLKDLDSAVAHDLLKGRGCEEAGAKLFIDKCGSLGIVAAKALRSYLSSHTDKIRAMEDLLAKFTLVLQMKPEFRQLQDSLAVMQSRFRACSQVLKKCTFYLAIFGDSTDGNIQRSRLVRRWIAEGYSAGNDSNSVLEYAEQLLYKLADLGILGQQPQTSTSCQVYSLILEYIIWRETKENILLPLEISVLEGDSIVNTTGRVGQHLAIRSNWKREEHVFSHLDFSRLRSLTVSGEWQAFFISAKMRVLRVLDLEGTTNVEVDDLEHIGEMLPRLKFLSLRGCKEVSRLPDSLGDLKQLQTLDIRGTKVSKLPRSIVKLQKLQDFNAGTTGNGDEMVVGDQSRLHNTLVSWFMSPRNGQVTNPNVIRRLRGIGQLTALVTLGVGNVTTSGLEGILAELHNHKQLKNLHVSGVHIAPTNRQNMLPPISGQSWNIRFPQNIMKLDLEMPGICLSREDIQAISKLEKMHSLRLRVEDIQGGLPYFLCFLQGQHASSATAQVQPFGQLKVIDIVCIDSLHATFYEGEKFEQPKLSLEIMRYLTPEDIVDIAKLKCLHTLCLHFVGNNALSLESSSEQPTTFDQLKVLEISLSSKFEVKFSGRMMKELEHLKFDCVEGSVLQLSGIELLPSLIDVCLQGSFDEELRGVLESQLNNHPCGPAYEAGAGNMYVLMGRRLAATT